MKKYHCSSVGLTDKGYYLVDSRFVWAHSNKQAFSIALSYLGGIECETVVKCVGYKAKHSLTNRK